MSLSDFELTRIFFAIVVLLTFAHGLGHLFQRVGTPRVIGEIAGGFVLGPSVLGVLFPELHAALFHAFPAEGKLIGVLYWIGLVFLMFISGFEIQRTIRPDDLKIIVSILVIATGVSFLAGLAAPALYDFSPHLGPKGHLLSLRLIIAIAVAVTSIPVISKIFIDLGIIDTHFAKIVLVVATIEDVILWVVLAVATGLAAAGTVSLPAVFGQVAITVAFFAAALLAAPRVVRWMATARVNLWIRSSAFGYVVLVCFAFAAVASLLGVNVVFGAFLAGVVIGSIEDERLSSVRQHVREIGLGFFIPIYFAVVGLKLDLVRHFDLLFFLGFFLFAVLCKAAGTMAATALAGLDWHSSLNFAAAMNARGGPGIVLATIAYDLGIIGETFFSVLVVLAIATSLMTGQWFRYVLARGWELEPRFRPAAQRRGVIDARPGSVN